MYHLNVNVNLMVESVIRIKSGIIVNVDMSVEKTYMQKKLCLESHFS